MVVSVVAASRVASQVLPLPLLPMMIIFILTKLLKLQIAFGRQMN